MTGGLRHGKLPGIRLRPPNLQTSMNIVVTHPGKIGDLLFALPTAQYLSTVHGCSIDVYTSPYCRYGLGIVACQPCVLSVAGALPIGGRPVRA